MDDSNFQLTDLLTAVSDAVTKKQDTTKNFISVQQEQADRVAASSEKVHQAAQDSIVRLDKLAEAGNESRRLASSDNLLDRIELLGGQIINPGEYTRSGRTSRRAEVSQELSLRNQVHNITVQDSLADLAAAEAAVKGATLELGMVTEGIQASNQAKQLHLTGLQLDTGIETQPAHDQLTKKTLENQLASADFESDTRDQRQSNTRKQLKLNSQNLDSALDTQSIRNQLEKTQLGRMQIEENERLRNLKLTQMTGPQISELLQSADGKNKVEVDGMAYTQTELRERAKTLYTRERLSLLAPEHTDPQFAAKQNAYYESVIQTMNLDELKALKAGNGALGPDQQVPLPLIDGMIATRTAEEADQLETMQARFAAENILPTAVEDAGGNLQLFRKGASEAPGLKSKLSAYENQVAILAKAADNPNLTDKQRLALLGNMRDAEQMYINEVDKEAKRLAGNDKDLQEIHRQRLLGRDPNPVQMREVLQKRLKDDKPISSILPTEAASRLRDIYSKELQKVLQEQSVVTADGFGESLSKKEIRTLASERAVEKLAHSLVDDQLTILQQRSPTIEGFPAGGLSPSEWDGLIVSQADAEGRDAVMKEFDLSEKDLKTIHQGGQVEGVNGAEVIAAQREAAYFAEYQLLEQHQPGLGDSVAEWYIQNADALSTHMMRRLDPSVRAIMEDRLQRQIYSHVDNVQGARRRSGAAGAKMVSQYLNHDKDPKYVNAMLLQMDDKLSTGQKGLILNEIIEPVLKEAKNQNLRPEETMQLIEAAIQNAKPTDAALKSALSAHRLGRTNLMKHYKGFEQEARLHHVRKASSMYGGKGNLYEGIQASNLKTSDLDWAYTEDEEKAARESTPVLYQ